MFKDDYKNAVDKMVDNKLNFSAEDILNSVKNQDEKIVEFKPKKRKSIKRMLLIAAVVAALSSMTTVVLASNGVGPLANIYREIFKDEATAKIVEKGYITQYGKTLENDKYAANLVAITGDASNPMLVVDIRVKTEEVAKRFDTLKLEAYTLGRDAYENHKEDYGTCDGIAYRDSEDITLYHACFRGAPHWLATGEECIIDICKITFDYESDRPLSDNLDFVYKVLIPEYKFYPTHKMTLGYDEAKRSVVYKETAFSITNLEFTNYNSVANFEFHYKTNSSDSSLVTEIVDSLASNAMENLVLVVDGREYHMLENAVGAYYDDRLGRCFGTVEFPALDYENARIVYFMYNEKIIEVKTK